jgi:hypothetical protein
MSHLRFVSLLFASLACCAVALSQVLTRSELCTDGVQLMPGERRAQRIIEVGPATKLLASVDVTAKGNGILSVGDLRLRVLDEHHDGASYEGGMANVEFADVDRDGWKDLVIVGIANYTDEKTDAVNAREPFAFIYRYDPQRKSFRQTYKHASFALEVGAQPQ